MTRPWRPALALLTGLAVSQPVWAGTDPAVERGAHIAQLDCAQCHAVGLEEKSPNATAPTFRTLRLTYNPVALERRLHPFPAQGHETMPPRTLTAGEVSDVVAYIQSLEPRR